MDATGIIFGVFPDGRGRVELRNPEPEPHPAIRRQQPEKSSSAWWIASNSAEMRTQLAPGR